MSACGGPAPGKEPLESVPDANIHDHGAAIPQPLDDLVIAETRPIEIAVRLK
jgi:hypothetical protein